MPYQEQNTCILVSIQVNTVDAEFLIGVESFGLSELGLETLG